MVYFDDAAMLGPCLVPSIIFIPIPIPFHSMASINLVRYIVIDSHACTLHLPVTLFAVIGLRIFVFSFLDENSKFRALECKSSEMCRF